MHLAFHYVIFSSVDTSQVNYCCLRQILEKKLEYETVHQLFVDFKKAYDSVWREVLYNLLIEFGIPKANKNTSI